MSRASDLLSELESEVEDHLAEISRLNDLVAGLEVDVDSRQLTTSTSKTTTSKNWKATWSLYASTSPKPTKPMTCESE